ncbi:MAG: hypothetical protein ABSC73_05205 [Acidimicrobiales bacterium]
MSKRGIVRCAALGLAAVLALGVASGAASRPASRTGALSMPRRAPEQLKVTSRIDLGAYSQAALDGTAFAEAPNDTVYFASGSAVRAVRGDAKPTVLFRAAGPVLALAATNGDLYVEVGTRITEYKLPRLARQRSWVLPRAVMRPTSAGLFPSSAVLWSWSDWATDESGFEYATVSAISPSTSSVRLVDSNAYPADIAASSAGLYYETFVGTKDYLARATASGGRELSAPTPDVDAPLALGPGYVALFPTRETGASYVDEFSAATLAELHTSRLGLATAAVVGTASGVLAVESPCSSPACPSAKVVWVDAADGAETGGISVPDAQRLLDGTHPAAVAEVNGSAYLVRLS